MKWHLPMFLAGILALSIASRPVAIAFAIPQSKRLRHSSQARVLQQLAQETFNTSIESLNSECRPQGHLEAVSVVAITPDGKTLVTGSDDATIRVWDLVTGQERRILWGHSSKITALQLTPDSQLVVSGSSDGTVRVWNLATGKLIHTFFHPSERHWLGRDWDLGDGFPEAPIEAIALSPDARTLVSSDGFGNLKVWDFTTGQELSTLGQFNPEAWQKRLILGLKFSPDGRELLIGSLERSGKLDVISVSRWNLATGKKVRTLPGIPAQHFPGSIDWAVGYPLSLRQTYLITATMTISPDGKYAAMESSDGLVIQDLVTGQSRQLVKEHFASFSLSISPDSRNLIAQDHKTITIWALETGKTLQVFQPPKTVHSWLFDMFNNHQTVAIAPDGKTAVSGGLYGSLSAWDMETGQLRRQLSQPHREIQDVRTSADGNTIVALMQGDDVLVKTWDLTAGRARIIPIREQDDDYQATHITIALSPDGKTLVTGHSDGSAKVWDTLTGRKLRTLKGREDLGFAKVAISPDGKTLVKGMSHRGLEFWDLETGKEIRILKTEEHGASFVAISADSRTIATFALVSNEIKLWDMQTGRELRTLKPENSLSSVAISPDSRWLLGGQWDGKVTLWNLQTGQELRTVKVIQSSVESLAILPDGKTLVVGSRDRFIRLWDLSTEKDVRILDGTQRAAAISHSDADGTIWTFTTSNPRDVDFAIANNSDSPQEQNSRSLSKYWQTVTSFTISPDGKTLYSGSRDGGVKQWDLNTGKAIKAFCEN